MNAKEPVRLRQRTTPTGLKSLYLDIYVDGQRTYEYLKLYLVPERTKADKEKNFATMQLAEAIRAKRLLDIRNGLYGFEDADKAKVRFFDYYEAMMERRKDSSGNYGNWRSCLCHLHLYEKRKDITFADITQKWVQGFRDYLENEAEIHPRGEQRSNHKRLAKNSRLSYFNKLRACINQAYEESILRKNPLRGIESFKAEEGTRMYLTIDEVRTLARTPIDWPQIRTAFLFSCLTGLRRSDIERLTWGDVHQQGDFVRIIFRQKKTKGQEYLDIAPEAVELMGERRADDVLVFQPLPCTDTVSHALEVWCARAGINKKITFHCGRHTFATMMLDLGTDIYTVSKLLGHKEISTTQIYAKVMDKNKQAAVAAIPSVLAHGREERSEGKE